MDNKKKNHYKTITALLGNFDSAIKVVNESTQAAGSIYQEQNRYLESMEAKYNKISNQFAEFASQFKPVLAGVLDLAGGFLQLENATGLVTIAIGALGVALGVSTGGLSWIIAGIASLLVGIPTAIDGMTTSMEEQLSTVQGLSSELTKLTNEYDMLAKTENRTPQQEARLRQLEIEIELLNRRNQVEKEALAAKVNKEFANGIKEQNIVLQDSIKYLDNYKQELADVGGEDEYLLKLINDQEMAILNHADAIAEDIVQLESVKDSIPTEQYESLMGQLQVQMDTIYDTIGLKKQEAEATQEQTKATQDYRDVVVLTEEVIENLDKKYKSASDSVDTLTSIMNDYNKTGKISNDTMSDLILNYPHLLQYIGDEVEFRKKLQDELQNELDKQLFVSTQRLILESDKVKQLSTMYEIDFNNFLELDNGKIKVTEDTIRIMSEKWAKYFKIVQGGLFADTTPSIEANFPSMGDAISDTMYNPNLEALKASGALNDKIREQAEKIGNVVSQLTRDIESDANRTFTSLKQQTVDAGTMMAESMEKGAKKASQSLGDLTEKVKDLNKSLNILNRESVDLVSSLERIKKGDVADPKDFVPDLGETEKAINEHRNRMAKMYQDLEKLQAKQLSNITKEQKKSLDLEIKQLEERIKDEVKLRDNLVKDLEKIRKKELDEIKKLDDEYTKRADGIMDKYDELLKEHEKSIDKWDKGLEKALSEAEKAWNKYNKAQEESLKTGMDGLEDKKEALESVHDLVMDMIKQEKKAEMDAIKDKINGIEEAADAQKQALRDEASERDYLKNLEKRKDKVAKLEKRIAELQFNTSAKGIAERLELEEQLAEAKGDLDDLQYENSLEKQEEAIDEQVKNEKDALEEQLKDLEDYLDKEGQIHDDANDLIQQGGKELYDKLSQYVKDYTGITESELAEMLKKANEVMDEFADSTGSVESAFVGIQKAIQGAIDKLEELSKLEWETSKDKEDAEDKYEGEHGSRPNEGDKPSIGDAEDEYDKDKDKEAIEKQKRELKKRIEVMEKMIKNGDAMKGATPEKIKELKQENARLGKTIGAWQNSSGSWLVKSEGVTYPIRDAIGVYEDRLDKLNKHHSGYKSGFVGGSPKLKSNEEFVKALDGELFTLPSQMDTFMKKRLPDLISKGAEYINTNSSNLNVVFNVEGGLDRDSANRVVDAVKSSLPSVLKKFGHKVNAMTAGM